MSISLQRTSLARNEMKTEVLRAVCLTYPLLQSKGLSVPHRGIRAPAKYDRAWNTNSTTKRNNSALVTYRAPSQKRKVCNKRFALIIRHTTEYVHVARRTDNRSRVYPVRRLRDRVISTARGSTRVAWESTRSLERHERGNCIFTPNHVTLAASRAADALTGALDSRTLRHDQHFEKFLESVSNAHGGRGIKWLRMASQGTISSRVCNWRRALGP